MMMAKAVGYGGEDEDQCAEGDDDVFFTEETPRSRTNGATTDATKTKTIDKYGFLIGSHQNKGQLPDLTPREVHQHREKKWLEMLGDWDHWMSDRFSKVRTRCRKGIPDSLRARAWQYLSCSTKLQQNNHKMYAVYLRQPIAPKQETEIQNDLHRSFPNHNMFADDGGQGQMRLYRVLRAYAAYNPSDGYCQAHAPIVSVLLMYMPEEEAFWCLLAMLDKYLPSYYGPQLEEVRNDGIILLNLLHLVHPKLYKRLKEANVDSTMFMVEWFMCLFARDLPWPSVLRIWDIFFCEGVKILFRIGLVLLRHCTDHLNKIPREMHDLLNCLKTRNMPKEILQPEFLVHEAYNLPIKERHMIKEHKKVVRQNNTKSNGF